MKDRTPGNRSRARYVLVALAATVLVPTLRRPHAASGVEPIDTVDVEVGGRETVLGTLRPAEERETFLLTLPRGAKVKATIKGTGPGAPPASVDITDPDGDVLGSGIAAKAGKTPQVETEESGVHRFVVCGDGVADGDYRLKLKAKPPRAAKGESEVDVEPAAEAQFTFGAPADATATVTISASGGSPLRPTILEITGPDDLSIPVEPPAKAGKRHVLRGVELPVCGDYTVRFRNDGEAAGGWKANVRMKSPKVKSSTLVITDDVLAGEYAGEQGVYARVIDELGGSVIPDDDDPDLAGVAVVVPADAVLEPTLFTISESDTFFVDDDLPEGGLTFELGPSGISFTEDVVVTVPFDAQAFDDPLTEVQIAIRDGETGEVTIVTGVVDAENNTCTFPTSHFSEFQPVSPRPRPLVGGYVEVELGGRIDDRSNGTLMMGLNGVVAQEGQRTGNPVARILDRRSISFGSDGKAGFAFSTARETDVQTGLALADDTLTMRLGNQDVVYERGRTPDALVRADTALNGAVASVLLRRVRGKTYQGALRGRWHGVVYEFEGVRSTTGGIRVSTTGQTFDLDVDPTGRAFISSSDLRTTTSTLPGGRPVTSIFRKAPPAGTLLADGPYAVLSLQLGAAQGPPLVELHPVARGDVLVGVAGETVDDGGPTTRAMSRLVLLIRAGESGGVADLAGRSRFVSFDAGLQDGALSPAPLPVLELLRLDVLHDGKGSLRATGDSFVLRHGFGGTPQTDQSSVSESGKYSVDKDLGYRETTPLDRGAVLRRRGFYVSALFDQGRIALGFGLLARPLPEPR